MPTENPDGTYFEDLDTVIGVNATEIEKDSYDILKVYLTTIKF